jgi:chemotaxis protein methyltransferase CheR
LLEQRASSKSLRIWSAGCAGGQEPSSIAIILKEHADALADWRVEIVGTDISRDILEKARSGVYSQFEVQRGLPVHHLLKYFKQVGERWQLAADIRSMVTYKVFNLLDDASDFGTFDVVFCRNVLAYFDQPTRARVLDSIGRRMPEDGFLYLGVGETALGTAASFRPHAGCRGVFSRLSPSQAQAKLAS